MVQQRRARSGAAVKNGTRRLWSQNALAEELGVDRRTVKARLADVPPDGTLRGHPAWFLSTAAPAVLGLRPGPEADEEAAVARMSPKERYDHYRAKREKIKLETEMGQLIPAAEVEAAWARVIKAIVTKLDTLADVLERDCGLPGPAVERVQVEVDRMREDLSAEILALDEEGEAA